MAVVDATTVDQVAQAPDGRVLLAMTEDRRYATGDVGVMTEDFRQKLNAYVHLVRSGQLRQMVGERVGSGVEIRLFCFDDPPPGVQEMITVASEALAAEEVSVGWTVHALSTDDVLATIGRSLAERAPAGWVRIELSASLVGDGLAGGLVATLESGEQVELQPDGLLIGALRDLKRAVWTPERGTWLTFRAVITGTRLQPHFDHDQEPPGGAGGFKEADWAEELRRYPRPEVPRWWRNQLP